MVSAEMLRCCWYVEVVAGGWKCLVDESKWHRARWHRASDCHSHLYMRGDIEGQKGMPTSVIVVAGIVSNVRTFQDCMHLPHVSSLTCISRKSPSRQIHTFEWTALPLCYVHMLSRKFWVLCWARPCNLVSSFPFHHGTSSSRTYHHVLAWPHRRWYL
jgi:hypothetical protein